MAIQMRRGENAAFDATKMKAGEIAVVQDEKKVIVSFEDGAAEEMTKGEKGDPGTPAGFGAPAATAEALESDAAPTVSVTASGEDTAKVFAFSFGIPKGARGEQGEQGQPGEKGDTGQQGYNIGSTYKKSGTGAPGTTDTYGMRLNDEDQTEVGEFSVYNGADGSGAGDMTKAVYDSDGDGIVDAAKTAESADTAANAEKLGGNTPDYYAAATDVPTKTSQLTNDSDFATNADVDVKVASLVDSAPETLNTLNELSAALGDDPNFAATVAQQIGEKVPQTRTVNGHALTEDIELSADDVGAATPEDVAAKQSAPASATALPTSGTALTDNTIYTVSATIGTYQFVAPASGWAHGTFTTGSSVAITFEDGAKYLGAAPEFAASTTYEFDVFNGVWTFMEVVSE